jgi:twitching motility protein PilT
MPAVDALLETMVKRGASDLHLTTTFHPYLRVFGEIMPIKEEEPLTAARTAKLVGEIMPEENRKVFATNWDTDFAYELHGLGRFRVNAFQDRHGPGAVFRLIPSVVPTIEELGLPSAVRDFCYLSKGMVVVTGPTGSGKSTTLAAMVDHINKHRTDHIITIEDPIEFVHQPVRCLINQREVHRDTRSFANALRAALREDPDIVLVGEMRDLETIEIAIETAETGHLVLGTLHTNTAASTVDRMIDKFPSDRQNQIRSMLADSLKGAVAQTLCKKIGGGRVAAFEVLVINTGISSQIREGKTYMITSAMQTGRAQGMQNFTEEYMKLVLAGKITPEEAFIKSVDKEDIRTKLTAAGFTLAISEDQAGRKAPDRTGEYAALVKQCHDTLKSDANNLNALLTLALVLATSPSDSIRNGREAVRCAEKANSLAKGSEPEILQALAAAYAENGSFRKALETARKALDIAAVQRNNTLIASLNAQIRLYERDEPYRDA